MGYTRAFLRQQASLGGGAEATATSSAACLRVFSHFSPAAARVTIECACGRWICQLILPREAVRRHSGLFEWV